MIADAASGCVFDFAVSWYGSTTTVRRITEDRVVRTLAVEVAAVGYKMPNQIDAFHATGTSTDNVSQMALPGASFSAFSA